MLAKTLFAGVVVIVIVNVIFMLTASAHEVSIDHHDPESSFSVVGSIIISIVIVNIVILIVIVNVIFT